MEWKWPKYTGCVLRIDSVYKEYKMNKIKNIEETPHQHHLADHVQTFLNQTFQLHFLLLHRTYI